MSWPRVGRGGHFPKAVGVSRRRHVLGLGVAHLVLGLLRCLQIVLRTFLELGQVGTLVRQPALLTEHLRGHAAGARSVYGSRAAVSVYYGRAVGGVHVLELLRHAIHPRNRVGGVASQSSRLTVIRCVASWWALVIVLLPLLLLAPG